MAEKYDVIVAGDFCSPEVLEKAGISRADVVILTVPDFQITEQALKAIRHLKARLRIDPVVIAWVADEVLAADAKKLGASGVVPTHQTIADAIVNKIEKLKRREIFLVILVREI